MNQNQWLKQMLDFNRTTFDNIFGSVALLQEQSEKAANGCMAQAAWMPESGKTVVNEWMKVCKKMRESFKDGVDDSFKTAESFFADPPKSE